MKPAAAEPGAALVHLGTQGPDHHALGSGHVYGYPEWANVVGIRADEAHRLRDGMTAPMVPAGVTKADAGVLRKEQPSICG